MQGDNSSIETFVNIRQSVSPVGGSRAKILVQYNYDTGAIRLNKHELHDGHKRAIIKFDEIYEGAGSIGLTKLEYIFMTMAKEVGIKTAEFELIDEGEAKHLLVKRFDRDEKWSLSPAYDVTYSKGAMKSHTTTIAGKDLQITRADVLKIAKIQSIKPAVATKIIDECIKVAKSFQEKAIDVGLDDDTLKQCKEDIESQIELLKA